ncbi:TetR/AcrR family transcriptional regulator [Dietzia massiliensis]|uniref:TetR/AcrR family transcriptional regulator n=1 Tax=Dietzia massiliensis TaxID=2697499 RepID=UPI001F1E8163|nr:helix-turn-helix domain-containing protein [Dietzia massiliensis]
MERTNEVPDDAGANGASQTRDAKTAMIEIAEKLIGERGLDRVSMRDVAAAAGQRNNSAVQYHFGGRDGLIRQVLRRRLTALDSVRQQRLAEIDEHGLGTDPPRWCGSCSSRSSSCCGRRRTPPTTRASCSGWVR